MSTVAERVLNEGLQLPPEDRRRVAQELWNSLPEESQLEFDEEFLAEMDRRGHEMDVDPAMSVAYEDVIASAREAIRCVSASTSPPEKNSSESSNGMNTSGQVSEPSSSINTRP